MKKGLIYGLFIFTVIITIISSCSLLSYIDVVGKGVKPPSWDNKITVPVMKISQNLEDTIGNVTISDINVIIGENKSFQFWPQPEDLTDDIGSSFGAIPVNGFPTDLDSDGTDDISVKGFRSTDTKIYLRMSLAKLNSPTVKLPMSPKQIAVTRVVIDGQTVIFTNPVRDVLNNELIFVSTNFPNPSNDYYFSFGGDLTADYDNINIETFEVALKDNTEDAWAVYPFDDVEGYVINLNAKFAIGNSFEIACTIDNTIDVFTVPSQNLPLSMLSAFITKLKPFGLIFDFKSKLPVDMALVPSFTASDLTSDLILVDKNNSSTALVPRGTISYRNLIGPSPDFGYASDYTNSTTTIATTYDILSVGSVNMELTVKLLPASNILFISGNDSIEIGLSITGGASLSFEDLL